MSNRRSVGIALLLILILVISLDVWLYRSFFHPTLSAPAIQSAVKISVEDQVYVDDVVKAHPEMAVLLTGAMSSSDDATPGVRALRNFGKLSPDDQTLLSAAIKAHPETATVFGPALATGGDPTPLLQTLRNFNALSSGDQALLLSNLAVRPEMSVVFGSALASSADATPGLQALQNFEKLSPSDQDLMGSTVRSRPWVGGLLSFPLASGADATPGLQALQNFNKLSAGEEALLGAALKAYPPMAPAFGSTLASGDGPGAAIQALRSFMDLSQADRDSMSSVAGAHPEMAAVFGSALSAGRGISTGLQALQNLDKLSAADQARMVATLKAHPTMAAIFGSVLSSGDDPSAALRALQNFNALSAADQARLIATLKAHPSTAVIFGPQLSSSNDPSAALLTLQNFSALSAADQARLIGVLKAHPSMAAVFGSMLASGNEPSPALKALKNFSQLSTAAQALLDTAAQEHPWAASVFGALLAREHGTAAVPAAHCLNGLSSAERAKLKAELKAHPEEASAAGSQLASPGVPAPSRPSPAPVGPSGGTSFTVGHPLGGVSAATPLLDEDDNEPPGLSETPALHPELIPPNVRIVRFKYDQDIIAPGESTGFDLNGAGFTPEFHNLVKIDPAEPRLELGKEVLVTPNQIHGTLAAGVAAPTRFVAPRVLIGNEIVFVAPDPLAVVRLHDILSASVTGIENDGRLVDFQLIANLTDEDMAKLRFETDTRGLTFSRPRRDGKYLVGVSATINGTADPGAHRLRVFEGPRKAFSRRNFFKVLGPNIGESGFILGLSAQDRFQCTGGTLRVTLWGSDLRKKDMQDLSARVEGGFDLREAVFTFVTPSQLILVFQVPLNASPGVYPLAIYHRGKLAYREEAVFEVVDAYWLERILETSVFTPGQPSFLKIRGRGLTESFADGLTVSAEAPGFSFGKVRRLDEDTLGAPFTIAPDVTAGDYLLSFRFKGVAEVKPRFGSIIHVFR